MLSVWEDMQKKENRRDEREKMDKKNNLVEKLAKKMFEIDNVKSRLNEIEKAEQENSWLGFGEGELLKAVNKKVEEISPKSSIFKIKWSEKITLGESSNEVRKARELLSKRRKRRGR